MTRGVDNYIGRTGNNSTPASRDRHAGRKTIQGMPKEWWVQKGDVIDEAEKLGISVGIEVPGKELEERVRAKKDKIGLDSLKAFVLEHDIKVGRRAKFKSESGENEVEVVEMGRGGASVRFKNLKTGKESKIFYKIDNTEVIDWNV